MSYLRNLLLIGIICLCTSGLHAQTFLIDDTTASFITAGAYSPIYNSTFFLGGTDIMIYDNASTALVSPEWYELGIEDSINAAVLWGDDHLLLFSDAYYIVYDISTADIITSEWSVWPGFPEEWGGSLDAAVRWNDDEVMFFYANEYLLYNISAQQYTDRNYYTLWEGFPQTWKTSVDVVLNINGNIYILNDGEYIVLDTQSQTFSVPATMGIKR